MKKFYTTRSGSSLLGVKQDTLKHYALRFNIGTQPGGEGTPWVFTHDDLLAIREMCLTTCRLRERVESLEDREALGLGPLYNPDASPRR
jgi:hypothetical protein